LVAALHGLFDEGGTDDRSPFSCVAGYLFTPEAAVECDRRWRSACRDVPSGIIFSMSDLWRLGGPFEEWRSRSDRLDKRNRLAAEMAEIIADTALLGVVAAVEKTTLSAYLARRPDATQYLGSAYSLCVVGAMTLIGQALEQIGDDRGVHYFFEDRDGSPEKFETEILLGHIAHNENSSRSFRRLGHTFIPKGKSAGTNAADFFAWEWQNLYKSPEGSDVYPTLMRLIESRVRHFRRGYSDSVITAQEIVNRANGLRVTL
jgi:hypothetical protein